MAEACPSDRCPRPTARRCARIAATAGMLGPVAPRLGGRAGACSACVLLHIPGAAGDVGPLLRERPVRALREDAPGTRQAASNAPHDGPGAERSHDRNLREVGSFARSERPRGGAPVSGSVHRTGPGRRQPHQRRAQRHRPGPQRHRDRPRDRNDPRRDLQGAAPDGNPTLSTLMRITRALGMQVPITVWRPRTGTLITHLLSEPGPARQAATHG